MRNITLQKFFFVLTYLISFVIETEFGNTAFIIPLRYIIYLVLLFYFFLNFRYLDKPLLFIYVTLLILSIISVIWSNQGIQIFFTFMLYILPFCIFNFNLFGDMEASGKYTFLAAMAILLLYRYAGFMARWNPNCIAYLLFYGLVSILFLTNTDSKRKKGIVYALYIVSILLVEITSSRNIMISMIVVGVIVLFPKVFKKKAVYTITCFIGITYSYLWTLVTFKILENQTLFDWLLYLSNTFFEKNTVFDGRTILLVYGSRLLKEDLFTYLFGHGHLIYDLLFAPHNNYIALMYANGLLGTFITAVFLSLIFQKAYRQISDGDHHAFVCFAILIGSLMQLGAESLMYGNDILVLMPYVFMAYIINKDVKRRNEAMDLVPQERAA